MNIVKDDFGAYTKFQSIKRHKDHINELKIIELRQLRTP